MEKKYYTAFEIAKITGGSVFGDGNVKICGLASLKEACPEDLSFLANKKYAGQILSSKSLLIITGKDFAGKIAEKTFIICDNPNLAFSKAIAVFAPPPVKYPPVTHPAAVVADSAKIGANVHIGACAVIDENVVVGDSSVIGAGCYIGQNSSVGKSCLIYPNVSIRERCVIGDRVIIHSGAVIGSDGFGFEAGPGGIVKIEQVGTVEIRDDVEIGANCAIDRARFGKTILKKGVKLDNMVHIAHNVVVGEYSMLIGQCGIAGSAEIGRGVIIAAQAGISGHLNIGDGAKVAGASGVIKDIYPGQVMVGTPAESPREFMERLAAPKKIRQLSERIVELEDKISRFESELSKIKNS
jgi:UDP-3-O-[3-hydroxymyristoyl] glucosamine N-acyltransferase